MRCRAAMLICPLALACRSTTPSPGHAATERVEASAVAVAVAVAVAASTTVLADASSGKLDNPYGPPGELANHFAYIPPQCYAKSRAPLGGRARNPCYTCHTGSESPNFVADGELQLIRRLPRGALRNPWRNLLEPAPLRVPRTSEAETWRIVRSSNYLVGGRLVLADALRSLPAAWDGQGDGAWNGFVPDVWYRFDNQGFDWGLDGAPTGWRAFASYPLPGAFLPTNGGAGDVLIRLDPIFRQDATGAWDSQVYVANLAIVEALIRRADVPIEALDERRLGTDLDLDGRLAVAERVAFRAGPSGTTPMHYAGKAREREAAGLLSIAPGLFPVGTEFFHTVRYLDVTEAGDVVPAAHLKELRYAKKVRWFEPSDLKAVVEGEAREQTKTADGSHPVLWAFDHGIDNGQGWYLQGFIEAEDGGLRPQTFEETAHCAGCHGGVGGTTDSIFSFSRKLPASAQSRGWFHFTQQGLRGVPEPRSRRGVYEYSRYLEQAQAGDDFADNGEVLARFFDDHGRLRPEALTRLHEDVTYLLLPSPERALALDQAYLATVHEQSFIHGRDALVHPPRNVVEVAAPEERTGVKAPIASIR